MDDVTQVLALVDRYTAAQQVLQHQTAIRRTEAAQMIRDLGEQAGALREVLQADPARWEALVPTGATLALDDICDAHEGMTIHDVKGQGISWRAEI